MLPTLPTKTRKSLLFSEEVGSGRINNVFFCFGHKNRSPGGIRLTFSPEPTNFSASTRPEKNFPTRPEVSRKIENLN